MIPVLMAASFCGALLLSWILNWLALIPWRRSAGAHWTVRARLLFPARRAARINLLLLPIVVAIATSTVAPQVNCLATAIPAFFGALLAGYFLNREMFPAITFGQWLQFIVAIWLFLSPVLVLLAAACVMPGNFGITAWIIAACSIVLLLFLQFGLNIRLLRFSRIFKPAPERLATLVRDVSEKMGVPAPATWIIDAMSNAAALAGPRQLVFTEKLLATHPDDEIKAICAHELGHLTEPEKVRLTRLLLPVFALPAVFWKPIYFLIAAAFFEFSIASPLMNAFLCSFFIVLIPLLCCLIVAKRLSRRMEKRADDVAVKHQENPAVYARALERLYQTNLAPAVMPRRMRPSGHPDLYDRMLAAGITPDFPKPAPPARLAWSAYVLIGICCLPWVAYLLVIAYNAFTIRIQQ